MPDGPMELWFAVFAGDGRFMGAAPAAQQPSWVWRNGQPCCNYSPVNVQVRHGGTPRTGMICAVSRQARTWRPLWPLPLDVPQPLQPGDFVHIVDGVISMIPEASCTELNW